MVEPSDAKSERLAGRERKHVTVLFSDLSGYTSLSERLDPEDVGEILGRILAGISRIIDGHGGHVDKFIGDEVMAVFGRPVSREDDASEAIRSALEIHSFVDSLAPEFASRLDTRLQMHSGINTGLVLASEGSTDLGAETVLGDTVNLAARLRGLAKAGEIVVGESTHRLAEQQFEFQQLEATEVKGKRRAVRAYRVVGTRERTPSIHRLSGLRSRLVGRQRQMARLEAAIARLRRGEGGAIVVTGDAGSGKSRLVAELRATLAGAGIQWLEGRSYPRSQDVAYSPFVDLLANAWGIEDGVTASGVRQKIHDCLSEVPGAQQGEPFLGALFGLGYPELEGVEPKACKRETQGVLLATLQSLSLSAPTVVHLEDLHWTDRASLELLRRLQAERDAAMLLLCTHRPTATLQRDFLDSSASVERIELTELSRSESVDMLASLLNISEVPERLSELVLNKAEGNPFYLEEVVNHLIERGVLENEADHWVLARDFDAGELPTSVQGIISARVDNLPSDRKRVIRNASVIGRRFGLRVLESISEGADPLTMCLEDLERHDLIRRRSAEPDVEYTFKHAVTQEVVYDGVLKTERRVIHGKVGETIERLFQDRIADFIETLAFHFVRDDSPRKAVEYLMRSGEKALNMYAVREAHECFTEAYALMHGHEHTRDEDILLIDLIDQWAYAYFYDGDNRGMQKLIEDHIERAESLEYRPGLGRLYCWLGHVLWGRAKMRESYDRLQKALSIGEETGDATLVGYATARLALTCAELGLLEEAAHYADRAVEVSASLELDRDLYASARVAAGLQAMYSGDVALAAGVGQELLSYGRRHGHERSSCAGYLILGLHYTADGDYPLAIESLKQSLEISVDPVYTLYSKVLLGMAYLSCDRFDEVEKTLEHVLEDCAVGGHERFADNVRMMLGLAFVVKGRMSGGLQMLGTATDSSERDGMVIVRGLGEYMLGTLYRELASGGELPPLSVIVHNLGFLLKNVPGAAKRSEEHYLKAIAVFDEAGAKNFSGWSRLGLGELLAERKRHEEARQVLSEAVALYDQCGIRNDREAALRILEGLPGGAAQS